MLDYVDGERIDHYATAHHLDVEARLRLFLQIADAVAHAHANLVVHRDLKPSNILVDRSDHVKLLDFGIAKLLTDDAVDSPRTLLATSRAFTPEFAAPEQAMGGDITTGTDVYALGVLFYQLLVGRHPTAEPGAPDPVLLRTLTEVEPPRPSDVAARMRQGEADDDKVLAERRTSADRLARACRGDLDTIVAKALKKAPPERYQTVTAFADDVRRHLRHEPIGARPDTLAYRARTFVRRHRWPVAAAAVVLMLLTAGLVVVDRQRRIAENRFRQLRLLSQQVFALDTRLFYLPGATEAREALVAMSLEYLEGLSADARSDRELTYEVADQYLRVARIQGVPAGPSLGDLARAEDSLKKADALVEVLLASQPRDLRAVVLSASIRHDRMIVADSERRDADALFYAAGAVERIESLLGDQRATREQRNAVVAMYGNVALANLNLRHYEEATRYGTRHLELLRAQTLGPHQVSNALSVLASTLRLQGDLEGSLKAIREARAVADQVPDTEPTRETNRYGVLLREGYILGEDRGVSLERPSDAVEPLREAFEMQDARARRDPDDSTSRTRVGTSGRALGNILRWQDPREALVVYDVALVRLREVKDNLKARRDTALVLASSAYALRRLNRSREAEQRIDEALAILTATKDYPTSRISFDGEVYTVKLARADHLADERSVAAATAQYDELLSTILATQPDVENDLRDANSLSLLYQGLARLQRLTGAPDKAAALDAKRLALWQHWNRKLPKNPFVVRRLAP